MRRHLGQRLAPKGRRGLASTGGGTVCSSQSAHLPNGSSSLLELCPLLSQLAVIFFQREKKFEFLYTFFHF